MHLCAALLGVGLSGPALAQADLTVALAGPAAADLATVGGTATYVLTITNIGTTHAHGTVTVDTTSLPTLAGFTPSTDGAVTVAGKSSNCVSTGTTLLPCTVNLGTGGLGETASVEVEITLQLPLPSPLATYACPVPATSVGDVVVSASWVDAATVALSATAPLFVAEYADLRARLTGPTNAGENAPVAYVATITNLGPCAATNVVAAASYDTLLTLGAVTGACTALDAKDKCALGNLAVDASFTFTMNFTTGSYPREVLATALRAGVSASSDLADPNADNDSAGVTTVIDTGNSQGCSSGGAGGALALLSILGLGLRRRRA